MKITDEMVDKACKAYASRAKPVDGYLPTIYGDWMREALEAAVKHLNRWASFSNEEVRELSAAESDRSNSAALPEELRERAHLIATELLAEDRRRLGGYQGPGVYEIFTGLQYDVLGRLGDVGDVVVMLNEKAGELYKESWVGFNQIRDDGKPTWRYVKPLEN